MTWHVQRIYHDLPGEIRIDVVKPSMFIRKVKGFVRRAKETERIIKIDLTHEIHVLISHLDVCMYVYII